MSDFAHRTCARFSSRSLGPRFLWHDGNAGMAPGKRRGRIGRPAMVHSMPLKEEQTMQEMINSMMRFSAAMTMFGMQQIQNAAELAVDSQSALKKFRENLDAVTDALIAQLDETSKPTLKSMTNLGSDLVDRT